MAPMKRAASKSAGKKRAAPVAKKCRIVGKAIRSEDSLPLPVRKLISDRLVHVFGTYKDDRHAFQNSVSDLVKATLTATQGKLQAAISEAEAKKAEQDAEGATVIATNEAADKAAKDAAAAAAEAKEVLNGKQTALKEAKASLNDLEAAVKTLETDSAAAASKKDKLEDLIQKFFTPVKEGTLSKALTKSSSWAGGFISKEFRTDFEKEFVQCVIKTFSKASSSWSTFDNIVNKELEELLAKVTAGLAADLEKMAADKVTRAAEVESAKAAVAATDEAVKAADEAHNAAAAASKDAKAASKAAASAVSQQQKHIDKAASAVQQAEGALKTFTEGPFAAYVEVEAHHPPTPPPVEAAADETEAPQAQAAMAEAPAPSQRSAMATIAASPSVLLSGAVSSVRNFMTSPRTAPSPQVQSS